LTATTTQVAASALSTAPAPIPTPRDRRDRGPAPAGGVLSARAGRGGDEGTHAGGRSSTAAAA
jgi:hypothetical protein